MEDLWFYFLQRPINMRVILVYEQLIFQRQDLKQTNKELQILTKTIAEILKAYKLLSFPEWREGEV